MARSIGENAENFHTHGFYLPTRTIFIDGDELDDFSITDRSARQDIKNLHIMDSISSGTINIILNCEGGDCKAGMAIYDAIRACKCHVKITVIGEASSMGALLLQAGDERIISANSKIMLHKGTASYEDNPEEVTDEWIRSNKKMGLDMQNIYLAKIKEKKPRYTLKQLQDLMKYDKIFSATKALEMGLVDKVLENP